MAGAVIPELALDDLAVIQRDGVSVGAVCEGGGLVRRRGDPQHPGGQLRHAVAGDGCPQVHVALEPALLDSSVLVVLRPVADVGLTLIRLRLIVTGGVHDHLQRLAVGQSVLGTEFAVALAVDNALVNKVSQLRTVPVAGGTGGGDVGKLVDVGDSAGAGGEADHNRHCATGDNRIGGVVGGEGEAVGGARRRRGGNIGHGVQHSDGNGGAGSAAADQLAGPGRTEGDIAGVGHSVGVGAGEVGPVQSHAGCAVAGGQGHAHIRGRGDRVEGDLAGEGGGAADIANIADGLRAGAGGGVGHVAKLVGAGAPGGEAAALDVAAGQPHGAGVALAGILIGQGSVGGDILENDGQVAGGAGRLDGGLVRVNEVLGLQADRAAGAGGIGDCAGSGAEVGDDDGAATGRGGDAAVGRGGAVRGEGDADGGGGSAGGAVGGEVHAVQSALVAAGADIAAGGAHALVAGIIDRAAGDGAKGHIGQGASGIDVRPEVLEIGHVEIHVLAQLGAVVDVPGGGGALPDGEDHGAAGGIIDGAGAGGVDPHVKVEGYLIGAVGAAHGGAGGKDNPAQVAGGKPAGIGGQRAAVAGGAALIGGAAVDTDVIIAVVAGGIVIIVVADPGINLIGDGSGGAVRDVRQRIAGVAVIDGGGDGKLGVVAGGDVPACATGVNAVVRAYGRASVVNIHRAGENVIPAGGAQIPVEILVVGVEPVGVAVIAGVAVLDRVAVEGPGVVNVISAVAVADAGAVDAGVHREVAVVAVGGGAGVIVEIHHVGGVGGANHSESGVADGDGDLDGTQDLVAAVIQRSGQRGRSTIAGTVEVNTGVSAGAEGCIHLIAAIDVRVAGGGEGHIAGRRNAPTHPAAIRSGRRYREITAPGVVGNRDAVGGGGQDGVADGDRAGDGIADRPAVIVQLRGDSGCAGCPAGINSHRGSIVPTAHTSKRSSCAGSVCAVIEIRDGRIAGGPADGVFCRRSGIGKRRGDCAIGICIVCVRKGQVIAEGQLVGDAAHIDSKRTLAHDGPCGVLEGGGDGGSTSRFTGNGNHILVASGEGSHRNFIAAGFNGPCHG